MDDLSIAGTDESPEIVFDIGKSIFKISGKSMPENVREFYKPVLNYLDEYIKEPNPETTVIFEMDYFNSATSKLFLDILYRFQHLHRNGNKINVEWHYFIDDEDMEDAGFAFSGILQIPFRMISTS